MKRYDLRLAELKEMRRLANMELDQINANIQRVEKQKEEEERLSRIPITILDVEESIVSTHIAKKIHSDLRSIMIVDGGRQVDKLRKTYVRKGNKITCIIEDKHRVGFKVEGISKCHFRDDFNYKTGIKIAEVRAMKEYYSKLEEIILG